MDGISLGRFCMRWRSVLMTVFILSLLLNVFGIAVIWRSVFNLPNPTVRHLQMFHQQVLRARGLNWNSNQSRVYVPLQAGGKENTSLKDVLMVSNLAKEQLLTTTHRHNITPSTILELPTKYPKFQVTCSTLSSFGKKQLYTYSKDMEQFIMSLRTVIPPPEKFSSDFRNPCWLMCLSGISEARRLLRMSHVFTDIEANLALSSILLSSRQHLVCVPKIFFIGFPKSGSTQLFEMLIRHPGISPGTHKETHWWTRFPFNATFPHNILAIFHYFTYFTSAIQYIEKVPQAMTIDASQSTIWDTRAVDDLCMMPSLIHSVIPSAKYIVIMREPVSRLYSDFLYLTRESINVEQQEYTNGTEGERTEELFANIPIIFHRSVVREIAEFNECMATYPLDVCTHFAIEGTTYLNTSSSNLVKVRIGVSLYYVHVAKWLKFIPREQFIFLRTEDLAKCPYTMLQRVWEFLDLPDLTVREMADILFHRSNSNRYSSVKSLEMLPETRAILTQFYQPFNEQLAQLLGSNRFLWKNNPP